MIIMDRYEMPECNCSNENEYRNTFKRMNDEKNPLQKNRPKSNKLRTKK